MKNQQPIFSMAVPPPALRFPVHKFDATAVVAERRWVLRDIVR